MAIEAGVNPNLSFNTTILMQKTLPQEHSVKTDLLDYWRIIKSINLLLY